MSRRQTCSLLLIAFGLFYLVPLSNHGLWIPDETRYAQISQAMLLGGDWVSPHFLGLRYFEKPVAGYWMIALGQAVFGENLFGVRIASVVTTALSVLLAYLLARRLWRDPRTSLACALLYASFGLIAGQSGYANLDPQFTFWVNLSLVALWYALDAGSRRARLLGWTLLGLACGIGFLTKGFLAWLLPVLVALPYMLWQRRWRELLGYGALAVLAALLVCLPWALAVHAREADYWRFFFWHERIRRFAGEDAQHSRPWWFYLPLLAVACLPWSGLLPSALRQAWHERRQAPVVFLALWLLLPLAFFSLSRGKLPTYIMPCLLPLALLMGHALVQRLRLGNSVALRGNGLLNLGLALLALAALAYLQLRKPVYQEEPFELFLVLLVIGAWAAAGLAQWRYPLRAWAAPLLASWVLIALLPAAMPNHVVQNKTPDLFVAEHLDELTGARHLLSNDLGAASALAWRLRRSDVTLYDTRGELKYGLSYPEHSQRSVPLADIRQWLWRAHARTARLPCCCGSTAPATATSWRCCRATANATGTATWSWRSCRRCAHERRAAARHPAHDRPRPGCAEAHRGALAPGRRRRLDGAPAQSVAVAGAARPRARPALLAAAPATSGSRQRLSDAGAELRPGHPGGTLRLR